MTPEGRVKAEVKKLLARYTPIWTHWPVQVGYGTPTLDCTAAYHGLAFAIETKAPGEKLTARQEITKRNMEAAGVVVFVVGEKALEADDYRYSGMRELDHWLSQIFPLCPPQ